MKKKFFVIGLIIIIIITVILIGYTQKNIQNSPRSGKIVIWNSASYNEYLQKRIDRIESENSKISIEIVNKNEEEILNVIEETSEEKPDIVILNSKYNNEIDASNLVITDDILQDYQNNFYKGRLKECKNKSGVNMGIPLSTNPQMLFIDKKYMEEYDDKQLSTWSDFINFGNSIKENLSDDEAFLSLNSDEYRRFIEILYIQQGIGSTINEDNKSIDKIKEDTLNFINQLKEDNLLSINSGKKSVCSIGSNNKYQELLKSYGKENIVINDLPVFILGANGAVTLQGDNFLILSEKKKDLIKFVLINLITDFDDILDEMNNGGFFISYAKAYKKSEFGEMPYPQMINVESRAIEVENRDILNKLIEESLN